MNIDHYKVKIEFDLATHQEKQSPSNLAITINMLVSDTLKLWAKDYGVLLSPTSTNIEVELKEKNT
mgnify:CR=1 FL=1